ncbi:hypothetical protein KDW40_02245 [Burkholderia cenocepacia]|uniref:hypothetical protein n=1 Tax=Burkholderia cenocepacia TaxID=95486 RepID=UPI001BA21623|nr:hypothetical protein [Burkholderia cenocepacia]MBR8043386.1 hypothetical protein [Burkholderia cenocepacia]MBR8324551.1 hypothetical protein [Burkholderia cenocepacia]
MSKAKLLHRYTTGTQVTDANEKVLGHLTDVREEGGTVWGVINGDYEVALAGSIEVLDLFGTARARNPALAASYVRLSRQASATPTSWLHGRLKDVSSRYGAPMGRPCQHLSADARLQLVVHECPIDSQGYDEGGAYWGVSGKSLWRACAEDGFACFVRAADRRAAIAEIRGMYPNATILDVPFDRWIEEFLIGYQEAALFFSLVTDEDGNEVPLKNGCGLAERTEAAMRMDCMAFARANVNLLRHAYADGKYSPNQAGRDLWLTRNHHGVGFWDRSELDEPLAVKLGHAAHNAGERSLYLGDDQLVYQMESPEALAA